MSESGKFSTTCCAELDSFSKDLLPGYYYAPNPFIVDPEYCKATIDDPNATCKGTADGVQCQCNDGYYNDRDSCKYGTPPLSTTIPVTTTTITTTTIPTTTIPTTTIPTTTIPTRVRYCRHG